MEANETQEQLMALRSAFDEAADVLGLQAHERELILGGPEGRLDRIGLFVMVFEEAGDLLGEPGWWLKAPNTGAPFNGKAPLAYILEDPLPHMVGTLRYVGITGGGWV